MSGEPVLVTGAAGFMGSHVVDGWCPELGMDVVATADLSWGYRENVSTDAHCLQGDVRSAKFVRSLLDHGLGRPSREREALGRGACEVVERHYSYNAWLSRWSEAVGIACREDAARPARATLV
jgi:NAD(P)-dependent dehydrogenase (short-subunit alcohol dehydrogenase family)